MPELPEVEIVRQSLEKKVRDKIIQKVLIKNRNLRFKIQSNFQKHLLKKKIKKIDRFSKYIIITFDDSSGFIIHLGFFASLIQIISNNNLQLTFLEIESGKFLIFYIVLIAILMDSIAFFAGKSLGKRPFITNVSPNKTLEGFMAAIILTPFLLSTISLNILNLPFFLVLCILMVVSLYSVLGDAFASMMKRVVEVKDYSNLIPGHGGLFDRLDSHIAAFPCFVFLLNIV